jgi:hypothetical protein
LRRKTRVVACKSICDRLEAGLRQPMDDHVAPIASFATTLWS